MRDLWEARWHAAGLALLVAMAVTMVAGTSRGGGMLETSRSACLQRLNAAHLDIRCSPTLPGVLDRAGPVPGVADFEERMLLDGVLACAGAPTVPVIAQVLPATGRPRIYAVEVLSGRWPRPDEEALLLDRSYAAVRNVSVGDEVELELLGVTRRLPVVGTSLTAEHVHHPSHPDFEVPVPGALAVVQLSPAAAKHFPLTDRVDSLLFRVESGTDKSALTADLLDRLPIAPLGVVTSDSDPSRRFGRMLLAGFGIATSTVTGVFLGIVLVLFVITIARRVHARRRQIGTLLAIGHPRLPIAVSLLGLSVVPTLIGGAAGLLGHRFIAQMIFDAHVESVGWAPLVDPGPGKEGWLTLGAGIGVAVVACMVPALAVVRHMPSRLLSPLHWQSAPGASVGVPWLRGVLRLPVHVVMGLTNVLRRPWITTTSVIALGANLAMILAFMFTQVSHSREAATSFGRLGLDGIVYVSEPKSVEALREAAPDAWTHMEFNLSRPAWFDFERGSTFMRISSVEPDGWISRFPLAAGRRFSAPDAPEMYVDHWIARIHGLSVGDKVRAFPYFSAPEGLEVEIVGILDGISIGLASIPIETGRRLYDLGGMATAVHVRSNQSRQELVRSMRAMPDVQHVTVLSDARAHVSKMFSATRLVVTLALVFGVLLVVVYLGILAAMDVSERSHELATLRAMGWRDRTILGLCVTEVATRGYLALALALPLSPWAGRWILDRVESANQYTCPLHHDVWMYLLVSGLALVLVPLGALPAWRAACRVSARRLARLLARA